mmetsp:Transcript_318/g.581  ORF Transcript_318/g.581 Transcript_318/m.581 type:complete len:344 (+) Transcript_318:27-1058(+)
MAKSKQKEKVVEEVMEDEEVLEEEEISTIAIEELIEHGINKADITKLQGAGIRTVKGVLYEKKKNLCEIKGLSEAKIDKIIAAANKLVNMGFITGKDAEKERQNVFRVSTGSKELNDLLQGGIESRSITEIFGESRTGKTQLVHTLCVTSQLPKEHGGGGGKVVFIDTHGSFRPERIKQIAGKYGLDGDQVLSHIDMCQVHTSDHQMEVVEQCSELLCTGEYALLIVDSLTGKFRSEYSGRGELSVRQINISKHMNKLKTLANEYNIAIVCTNQVVANPDGMFAAAGPKPIGGHIVAHNSTTRISLRKGRGEIRIAKIYDSPNIAESEVQIAIREDGIGDPPK